MERSSNFDWYNHNSWEDVTINPIQEPLKTPYVVAKIYLNEATCFSISSKVPRKWKIIEEQRLGKKGLKGKNMRVLDVIHYHAFENLPNILNHI